MALTHQDLDRIANLARLELKYHETGPMLDRLNAFFAVVEQMRAVDTTGVEPLAHPVAAFEDVALRLRPDAVGPYPSREDSQRSAPAVENGLFLVPKVIE